MRGRRIDRFYLYPESYSPAEHDRALGRLFQDIQQSGRDHGPDREEAPSGDRHVADRLDRDERSESRCW